MLPHVCKCLFSICFEQLCDQMRLIKVHYRFVLRNLFSVKILRIPFWSTEGLYLKELKRFYIYFVTTLRKLMYSSRYKQHFVGRVSPNQTWQIDVSAPKSVNDGTNTEEQSLYSTVFDDNLTFCQLQSRLQHMYYGHIPESTLILCQSRLYPQVRDYEFDLRGCQWRWYSCASQIYRKMDDLRFCSFTLYS